MAELKERRRRHLVAALAGFKSTLDSLENNPAYMAQATEQDRQELIDTMKSKITEWETYLAE